MVLWDANSDRCAQLASMILSIVKGRNAYGGRPGDIRYFVDRPLLDHPQTYQRDAIKYSTRHHYHTFSARNCPQALLNLEHAVPLKLLWELTIPLADRGAKPEELVELYSRLCRVAVITRREHAAFAEIGLRDKMPPGWDPHSPGADPWARYSIVGVQLLPPTGD